MPDLAGTFGDGDEIAKTAKRNAKALFDAARCRNWSGCESSFGS
jgi:hypothetical protein